MKVTVTGATWTIGCALVARLRARGDEVTVLSRDPGARRGARRRRPASGSDPDEPPPADALRGRDAVVHLAGETVAQRWNDEIKREIRDSRILSTRHLVAALAELPETERPTRAGLPVCQPAGTGPHGDERLDETAPAGRRLPRPGRASSGSRGRTAAELGLRVVLTRTGVVLSGPAAPWRRCCRPSSGHRRARGRRATSTCPGSTSTTWSALYLVALDTPEAGAAPVNVTAPEPVTNKEFSGRSAARCTDRRSRPCPASRSRRCTARWREIVVTGQRAVPGAPLELGYELHGSPTSRRGAEPGRACAGRG